VNKLLSILQPAPPIPEIQDKEKVNEDIVIGVSVFFIPCLLAMLSIILPERVLPLPCRA
jgi:hypothetical protein